MRLMVIDSPSSRISAGSRLRGFRPTTGASRTMWPGWLAVALAPWLALPAAAGAAGSPPKVERTLLIALDAVPYPTVARLTDPALGEQALFRGYRGPVPMISTFPSTTSLALGGILGGIGLDHSPGYEHRYYDLELDRKRGGGPLSYHKLLFPWRRFFDFETKGVLTKGIKLFRLDKASRHAIAEALAAFLASDKPKFFAYFDLTDMIAHVRGPDGLDRFLGYLDRGLRDLRASHPELDLTVVLYSDHGMDGGELLVNIRKDVHRALHRGGFDRAWHLGERTDVVIVPYGLVSSLVAFTRSGREAAAARAIVGAEGVDFCVAADRRGPLILSRRGSARILHRPGPEGDLYGYRPLSGDPLGYGELAEGPGPGGEPAPWRPDRWWLEATRGHRYPDALYRAVRAFDLVDNPASVVCSVADGYMYGAAYTAFGSRLTPFRGLRFTHGAMERGDTLGFVMSDDPAWQPPPAARFDEALAPWGD
jgi:hypothetical protein